MMMAELMVEFRTKVSSACEGIVTEINNQKTYVKCMIAVEDGIIRIHRGLDHLVEQGDYIQVEFEYSVEIFNKKISQFKCLCEVESVDGNSVRARVLNFALN